MKIACLYFPTSSVGGIATDTAALRGEAKRRGDTFHALVCANASTHRIQILPETKRIRGGDTFIDIDGYAPHAEGKQASTAKWLNENYDLVYLAFLCPHPTKAYGNDPIFLPLLQGITKPIVGYITDGYFDTYADWGNAVLAMCSRVMTFNMQYLPTGYNERFPHLPPICARPFEFHPVEEQRTAERSLAWVSQWKNIKGVEQFLTRLPQIQGQQELYSNGIRYYQLRTEPSWKAAVGKDLFKGFHGDGRATFYGWQPMDVICRALARAWFMPEFQGLGRPRYAAYRNGSLNHTIGEALYYECTPVIPQMTIDGIGIPPEAAIGVRDYDDMVPALNGPRASRPDLGKQWVLDNFDISVVYDKFFGGLV